MPLPTGRIPTTPLSYENKDLARNREVLVDWSNGELYLKIDDGSFISITQTVYNAISENGDLGDSITITIEGAGESGGDLTLNLGEFSNMIYNTLEEFREQLKNFANIDEETGEVTIKPDSIVTDSEHRFVTDTQISLWNGKASKVTFNSQIGTAWTGSAAPYTQTIQLAGILATDEPVVDVLLSDSVSYQTAMDYLEAWGSIYRITTQADQITVYSSKNTATVIPIKLMVVR